MTNTVAVLHRLDQIDGLLADTARTVRAARAFLSDGDPRMARAQVGLAGTYIDGMVDHVVKALFELPPPPPQGGKP